MKNTMFKLAGVKTEKQFYDKFPTEEAFMAKHGKAFKAKMKKAQWGEVLQGAGGILGSMGTIDEPELFGGKEGGVMDKLGGAAGVGSIIGGIGEGISAIKAGKEKLNEVTQGNQVAGVALEASQTMDVDARRQQQDVMRKKYNAQMRPINGEELFPVNGVGTNVLAKNGKTVKAQFGFEQIAGIGGGILGGVANKFTQSGGGKIGQSVASTAAKFIPGIGQIPGVSQAAGAVGAFVGDLIDKNPEKIKKQQDKFDSKMSQMYGQQFGNAVHNSNSAVMQHGGTSVGEEITPLWGGGVKHASHNPYTLGEETVMFSGNSHKEGGIGIDYSGNKIEAESGEPAMKIAQHGTDGEGMVIFGDLSAKAVGGKGNFKNYVKGITEQETKVNNRLDRSKKLADSLEPIDKFDRLTLGTQDIIQKGGDVKLKKYADKKEEAAFAQNAINQTAEEFGLNPVDVAKGGKSLELAVRKKQATDKRKAKKQAKLAEHGDVIYAQGGETVFNSEEEAKAAGYELNAEGKWEKTIFEGKEGSSMTVKGTPGSKETKVTPGISPIKDKYDGSGGYMDNDKWAAWLKTPAGQVYTQKHITGPPEVTYEVNIAPTSDQVFETNAIDPVYDYATIKKTEDPAKEFSFDPNALSALAPLFGRGTDAERLNHNQLYGEMFALANNKLEPVQAQSYKPDLNVPYDISYQDSLNRNTSNIRGAQKMMQGNPAAQAMLQAQAYSQDQPVLSQQFRDNQAMKNSVYSGNRATLNDAKLKNLDIFDKQDTKQSIARSNTKEATQLALNSISDKYAKNLLEQRTLKTYENMYNYRFGKNHRAYNVNDPVNAQAVYEQAQSNALPIWTTPGIISKQQQEEQAKAQKEPTTSKYGSMTKALKRF